MGRLEIVLPNRLHPTALGNGSQRTVLRTPGLDNLDCLGFLSLLAPNAGHTMALHMYSPQNWPILGFRSGAVQVSYQDPMDGL